ncbi:replication protein RepA (plasmid) [Azospirillum sp. HJ39]|uniref:replication protein RepA n=1 Tax=Azospirillum sp. HJ39 TaxID=3159496 RepID=UPI003556DCEC
MATVHKLIRTHGRDIARAMIPHEEIPYFQIASSIMEEESNETGITYSGFCMTSLPHRRLPDDLPWVRSNGSMSLLIEPGRRPKIKSPRTVADYELVGVPYGAKARLILLYLQTEALRNNSPVVELGRSMNNWLERMDISSGGATYREVKNQAERISRCKLTFDYEGPYGGGMASGHRNDSIVRNAINLRAGDGQGNLWDETVQLSDSFFMMLKDHPVPVWEPAIRAISGKSAAIDIYIWLAYRLHVLERPTQVSWAAVYEQFGAGRQTEDDATYRSRLRAFKPEFRRALQYALSVYEDAVVQEADDKSGLILHRSPPAVPERLIGKIGA